MSPFPLGAICSADSKLFPKSAPPWQSRSAGHAHDCRDLFPNHFAVSGGTRLMPRILRHLFVLALFLVAPVARAQSGGVLHFCLHGEPKTFNPVLVDDEASENIRYLTGGVLIRLNRQTQVPEPALATSWRLSKDGRKITLQLRKNIHFSDGNPFTSEDVAYTMKMLMDPQVHSATG